MTSADRWLLPEGVEEILPQEAAKLETLRRQILDLYGSWGYELVITPLVEFLDSQLVGSSHDLDLHTFKVTDQLSGRMMGIRADITPQVARIDAHCLNRQGPSRLCYADNVLHTKPRGLLTSRIPIRVGAELFGHAGIECDVELICLMQETLRVAGVDDVHLVLGHVGLFRNLLKEVDLEDSVQQALFIAVQRKAYDEISGILDEHVEDGAIKDLLYALPRLSGGEETLAEASEIFASAPQSMQSKFAELKAVVSKLKVRLPDVKLCFDLCELRGYEYHTGIVFAAYTPNHGRAVAKGGRYDDIGEVFGRARPASGFDSDLKILARLSKNTAEKRLGILAPFDRDDDLELLISLKRQAGEKVVDDLGRDGDLRGTANDLACDRTFVKDEEGWKIVNLAES